MSHIVELIDSHCHLDFSHFNDDRDELLAKCSKVHINKFVLPGVVAAGWPALMRLVDDYPSMWGALGLHPMFMHKHQSQHIELLETYLMSWNALAVGEIGLDFYASQSNADTQIMLFKQQLNLAKQMQLPVILHVRKAHDQVLSLLRKFQLNGGIVHAFSGSEQQARQYIDLGFVLGVGGVITYPRATRLRKTLSALPLSALVLESDAPDMSPSQNAGERNTPLSLLHSVTELSRLHHLPAEEIAKQTSNNVQRVLNLPLV